MGANSRLREALLVVGTSQLSAGDSQIKSRLENLRYRVTTKEDWQFQKWEPARLASSNDPVAVIVISSSVDAEKVNTKFRDLPAPIVVSEALLFRVLGMTAEEEGRDYGLVHDETEVVIVHDQSHPIAADLADRVKICSSEEPLAWGRPSKEGKLIAALPDYAGRAAIFAYDHGDQMYGLTAPARRVGIFLTHQLAARMTDADLGWELFDAAVEWASGETPKPLSCVLQSELKEIRLRREQQ